MSLTSEHEQLIVYIDKKINEILSNNGDDKAVMLSVASVMKDLKKIMDSTTEHQMNLYCQQYEGFYYFMKLLEDLALGISNGSIPVPNESI